MDEQRAALLEDELHAWASERGNVYRSARDMVVVHGGVTEHHHEHYHSGGESTSRTSSPSEGEECPYPGLRAFDTDEAEWFFGREALVSRVMNRLELCVSDHSPLAVVAPSGAGKSSLLRAGVLPGLAQGRLPGSRHWPQLLLTPTAEPLAALASGLGRLTGAEPALVTEAMEAGLLTAFVRERLDLRPDRRVVLVVDQLEELFTVCQDEPVRRRFVDVLAELAGAAPSEGEAPGGEAPVALAVYGLRADFYGPCSAFPYLRDALVERQVIVGPMSDDEVRRAVTMPAERARLTLAPGLVDVVLRDLRGSAPRDEGAYETGRLPLLAHALRATWLERRGDTLTVDSYRDTGGIDGAVAATAEEEFGKLTPSAQRAARLMFLGLVRIGEDGEVTRRRRTRADLLLAAAEPREVPDLAERFTRARLLTQGVEGREGTVVVEVTHEALLWAWPRLHRDWIGTGKSGMPVRQEVEEAAVAWERGDRKDATTLHRGAKLVLARSWASGASPEDLTPLVTEFLAASERQQRRGRRLRRGAVAAVSLLAVLAMVAATVAFQQSRNAVEQRDNAIFDRVSAEADRQRETNGALAAQLDLVAHRMRPTDRLNTRLTTAATSVLPSTLPGHFGTAPPVTFGPEGRLATGGSSLRFWDTKDAARPASLAGEPGAGKGIHASAIAYNAKGDLLARGGGDGKVQLLDVSDPKRPVALNALWSSAQRGLVASLQFSPDSRTLAVVVTDISGSETSGTVYLIDVSDPRRPRTVSTVVSVEWQVITSVAYSRDGRTLAVTGGTGRPGSDRRLLVRLWNVSDPARPKALGGELGEHGGIVNKAAFSPVAAVLATAGGDGRVRIWDVADPRRPKVTNTLLPGTTVTSLAFSPGGHLLAAGDNSGNISIWNMGDPAQARWLVPPLRGHSTLVSNLAFAPTGLTLVSGGGDGKVHLWRLPTGLSVLGGGKAAEALALTGEGRLLAVASGPHVTLYDLSDPTHLDYVGVFTGSYGSVSSLAFMPRKRGSSGTSEKNVLATGGWRGDVRLWDVSAPTRPMAIGNSLPGQTKPVSALAFGADGTTLVAASMDLDGGYYGGLRAWNVADPARPAPLGGELDAEKLATRALAVGGGSGHLYSAEFGGDVRGWRTGEGTALVSDGGPLDSEVVMSLDAHPRAPLVATGGTDGRIRLFDVSRPSFPKAIGRPPLSGGALWSVGFAPDGTMLASGSSIGQIRFWKTSDPTRITAYGLPVTGHNGSVNALRYTPRGDVLVTAGQDGTVRLWQTDPARARAILCASTRSAMNPDVWKEFVSPALPYDPPCGK
ncbi:NACHT and WD repeat domain-containing protein [Streptomyces sp. NBC_01353]|uniref:NACHT and WD repeat domain-containing protein n=1 Tax=Streptomyces sp. NBC_01353 TaxID=2903835 RepID=UPI002E32DFD3|nr:NACHT and WD repeat domain-containing protein [Streptomyces sp. NBC_01353]